MTGIARYAMQGPRQAVLVAVLFAAIPLLYWVSAAIVSLVILRQGLDKGINVLLPALLPAVAWYALQQDIIVFAVILGSALMSAILRATVSLPKAVFSVVIPGAAYALLMPVLSDNWHELINAFAAKYIEIIEKASSGEDLPVLVEVVAQIQSTFVVFTQLFALAGLIFARKWQSELYNPGGFSREFHQLRMSKGMVVLVLSMSVLTVVDYQLLPISVVALTPAFIVGIGICHGVIAKLKLSKNWLISLYMSLFFLMQYMYALLILIALLDSVFDIRKRLKDTA